MTQPPTEKPLNAMTAIDRYAATIEGFARNSRDLASCRYTILGCAQNIREQVRQTTQPTQPIRYRRPSIWRRFTWWLDQLDTMICWLVMIAFSLWLTLALAAWALALAAWARSGAAPVGW